AGTGRIHHAESNHGEEHSSTDIRRDGTGRPGGDAARDLVRHGFIRARRLGPLDSGLNSRLYNPFKVSNAIQIGEAARQTGLTIDTIRFYQKIGLLGQPTRSQGGYRLFTEAEIHDLNFIREAQQLGFSLDDIRRLSILRKSAKHS